MVENTESAEAEEQPMTEQPLTSGHVERTILNHMVGDDSERSTPTTVGGVLDDIAAVIRRGEYGNIGPRTAESGTVRQSTIRRTFTQLREKGLVRRVEELSESELREDRFDLGTSNGDRADPNAYSETSDDSRVTDWILTDNGRQEVERLDARYAAELDELAARYGRPRGETTDRIDA
ncbi:hypothetical protein A4G99_13580 [Haladaptatus sp. R4]|uniref:hypothetical protein n=1 Tax=Haladaptatus sp. R4 TaxID=1679489 RepID=UPI0007B48376|nr:hypothetical protein [Haladaptatus sp. R4]KZN23868.1 hypothetical protein A4G99_13580 [Haladaptatus sp. R4]